MPPLLLVARPPRLRWLTDSSARRQSQEWTRSRRVATETRPFESFYKLTEGKVPCHAWRCSRILKSCHTLRAPCETLSKQEGDSTCILHQGTHYFIISKQERVQPFGLRLFYYYYYASSTGDEERSETKRPTVSLSLSHHLHAFLFLKRSKQRNRSRCFNFSVVSLFKFGKTDRAVSPIISHPSPRCTLYRAMEMELGLEEDGFFTYFYANYSKYFYLISTYVS
mmetsp:Transcript_19144/g.35729  ORF Transcript_19144/g.35729 Transcript_19144/m.35729 type:complete len:224 (-) Transcript_19144:10-681(-)